MSGPVQKKKPFFSCCAAEEDKNEAVIDFKDKKPLIEVHPSLPPYDIRPAAPASAASSKFRFTYQNPNHP